MRTGANQMVGWGYLLVRGLGVFVCGVVGSSGVRVKNRQRGGCGSLFLGRVKQKL